ncbi:hypothetical protein MLD38_007730 [Melastoma candidum]|uniref:Uncharacterized protein n=1 Tax=Melastoma candidum TaxID=119954 RepID=A0ACB9RRI0_9MYRT|nr:hypothetical protein MLD38_007730 [Melastoma candidum]
MLAFTAKKMTLKTTTIAPSKELPSWLLSLVRLGRFYRICEFHGSNFCNIYCMNCMGLAFCPRCKNDHTGSHDILTAYKASGAATLRTRDLKLIWDISDICVYVINSHQIVFIQKKGGPGHTGPSNSNDRCQNCLYHIKPQCSYCSIECKVEDIIAKKKREENANQGGKRKPCEEADADSKADVECKEVSPAPKSYRKRPRKGIPHRAPFF